MSEKAAKNSRTERAAAALKEQQRREQRRRITMIGGVLLVVLVVVVVGFLVNRSRDTTTDVTPVAPGSGEYGVTIGDPKAPSTVVVYEDFLCPFCAQFEAAGREDLARLAEEGKVYVEYRPFHLLDKTPGMATYSVATAAAFKVVLDASGPEVAKRFHDLLYENQPPEVGPYPGTDWLVQQAVAAGATEGDVRPGIESGEGEAWVQDATQAAFATGLRGTPTVLLDGQVYLNGRTMADLAMNLVADIEAAAS